MRNQCTFNGRPCPPEFKASLERPRRNGILDDPKFKQAFIDAAKEIWEEIRNRRRLATEAAKFGPGQVWAWSNFPKIALRKRNGILIN